MLCSGTRKEIRIFNMLSIMIMIIDCEWLLSKLSPIIPIDCNVLSLIFRFFSTFLAVMIGDITGHTDKTIIKNIRVHLSVCNCLLTAQVTQCTSAAHQATHCRIWYRVTGGDIWTKVPIWLYVLLTVLKR